MTARGSGTDQSGAAIGSGVVLVLPAHMNKVLELDPKSGSVAVQPGLNYGKLQQTLHTHGRFLPPYPASLEYSTIGGAIANNAGGEKSIKYGSTRDFVRSLRVVLANGEVIETRRISRRELNKKMGLNSLEGEIYRALDTLLEDNKELIKQAKKEVSKNAAGYYLTDIKHKDGSIDLTPLFVGSQGTLGIITEAIVETEAHNPTATLLQASFNNIDEAAKAVMEIRKLPSLPSAVEMVDEHLLNFIDRTNPNQLKGLIDKPYHKVILLVEFDDGNARLQKRMAKKAKKILERYGAVCRAEHETEQQEQLWKIRHAAAAISSFSEGGVKALPIIEDGTVPVERLADFIEGVYRMFERHHLQVAVWGHAGSGNLHMQPMLDLGQLGDRQKIFRLMDEYHKLVIDMGGTTTGEHGDGRLRGPYLPQLYGQEIYELFRQVKAIFDPHGTINPGVKMNVTLEDVKPLLRNDYTMSHLYDHLPRT